MSGLLDAVMSRLDEAQIAKIAGAIGADEATTKNGIAAALPTLLGGLAANAQQPQGAAQLDAALDDHDETVFDSFDDLLAGGGKGTGIVRHVLGDKQPGVANALAGTSGLSAGSMAKLLPLLAPLLMGVLGQKKKSGGLGLDSLGGLLGGEADQAKGGMPDLGDIFGMLAGGGGGGLGGLTDVLSGGGSGAKAKKSSGLGGLLGKLLGGRR
jgi:hypothetical protein